MVGRTLSPPCSLVSVLSLSTETTIIKHFTVLRDNHRALAPQKPTESQPFSRNYSIVSNGYFASGLFDLVRPRNRMIRVALPSLVELI